MNQRRTKRTEKKRAHKANQQKGKKPVNKHLATVHMSRM